MARNELAQARFAALAAGMTLLLILAGGFVTSSGTGDTIPAWPRSWGQMQSGWPVEWTHRALAAVVGILVAALAVWLQRTEPRAGLRRLAWIAFAAVVVQAAIGGLRIHLPRAAVAIVHACFAQVVFAATVATALLLSKGGLARGPAEARGIGIAATVACYLQLVAGAVTRHTGAALEAHLLGAVAVLLLGALFASRLMMTPLRRGGALVLGLLGAQIALGIAAWAITAGGFVRSIDSSVVSMATVSLHVAFGAAVMAACLGNTILCSERAPALAGAGA
jgi:cytochrome c oxidase assembly protein subunit 15